MTTTVFYFFILLGTLVIDNITYLAKLCNIVIWVIELRGKVMETGGFWEIEKNYL